MSEGELRNLLGRTSLVEAIAWRSPRAKAMALDSNRPPPDDELVRLMVEIPYLIRRPIIRISGETIFGFNRKRLERVLGMPGS